MHAAGLSAGEADALVEFARSREDPSRIYLDDYLHAYAELLSSHMKELHPE